MCSFFICGEVEKFFRLNRIDRISDKLESETETCEAVEDSFEDLQKILKKISSLKGSQVIITADHGFLFQQEPVYDNDRSNFPSSDDMNIKKRRFAIGTNIKAESGVKIFSANQLGLEGEWDAAFLSDLIDFQNQVLGIALFMEGLPFKKLSFQ